MMMDFWQIVESLRWQDYLDIGINGFVLFRLFVLFRGTVTARMVTGLAAIWVLGKIADQSGMLLTGWAINGIMALAALIVIVVFRHEIRRVFRLSHPFRFFWGAFHPNIQTSSDVIADAAFEMGKSRIGALMVLQNRENLADLLHNGLAWQGKISRDMLISIFWKDNPVHDGAAIICGDRITTVRAVLPMSQRPHLPTRFGTRHRAGAGIAEMSDAVVVVVSEEKGTVSVMKGREYRAVHSPQALKNAIDGYLIPENHRGHVFNRVMFKNTVSFFLAFTLVFFAWFAVSRGKTTTVAIDVPLEYRNQSPDSEIVSTSHASVKVHLSGSEILVKSITQGDVRILLDMAHARNGKNTFDLDREQVLIPPGIKFIRVEPSQVLVTQDSIVTRAFPIQTDWVGTLPKDRVIAQVTIRPTKVRLRGISRQLDTLSTVYTRPVSVSGISDSGVFMARLALPPESIGFAPGEETTVEIRYRMSVYSEPAGPSGNGMPEPGIPAEEVPPPSSGDSAPE